MTGPYDSKADTYAEPLPSLVRAIHDAGLHGNQVREACAEAVLKACHDAGVEVGLYDAHIIDWLANCEPSTVQVVIGLIVRAHESGKRTT